LSVAASKIVGKTLSGCPAFAEGNPADMLEGNRRKAYSGLALVIVRAKKGEAGTFSLTAKSEGLAGATTTIEAADLQHGK
jgi:hypothetical protein